MQKLLRMASLGLLFVMAGCVPSLHPLYTQEDLIFDPALVGVWADKEGAETWTFTKNAEKEYQLTYVDKDRKKGEFVVHLLKVKNRLFLDLCPAAPDLKENDFYKMHLISAHTFLRVQQIAPTLQMAMLNRDWIKRFLQENPGIIRHEKVDGDILLTAQPKELQGFLLEHEQTADAWNDCTPMVRRAEKPKE